VAVVVQEITKQQIVMVWVEVQAVVLVEMRDPLELEQVFRGKMEEANLHHFPMEDQVAVVLQPLEVHQLQMVAELEEMVEMVFLL
jgi:hypothetical protein